MVSNCLLSETSLKAGIVDTWITESCGASVKAILTGWSGNGAAQAKPLVEVSPGASERGCGHRRLPWMGPASPCSSFCPGRHLVVVLPAG